MMVPALRTKAAKRSHTWRAMVFQWGRWYRGNSMINAEPSPLKANRFTTNPTKARTSKGSPVSPQETHSACCGKKTGTNTANTPKRAVQGTNGARRAVNRRLRRSSMIRVPMMAGTLQPKPRKRGMKLFPCRPRPCIKRSII